MSGVNKVLILGRLGKDPESRTLENGNMVVNFSVATSEVYKDKNTGERKENTEWHNIVLWNQPAEIAAKYLHKGDQVFIEGKLKTRSWEKDGITRYTTEVVGNNITLLGKSDGSAPRSTPQYESNTITTTTQAKLESDNQSFDELPF